MQTPGVYINEINAFPNDPQGVATAVPAFIGYTAQAMYEGVSYLNKPVKINSLAEFEQLFCSGTPASYIPQYYLEAQAAQPATGNTVFIDGVYYAVLPDPDTVYYLHNSIRLFYMNGGGTAYIVSVGGYGPASGKAAEAGAALVNKHIQLKDLLQGLAALENESEPTMYSCPDATLLSLEDNGTLMQAMLQQAFDLQTAICIFDVIGARQPDPRNFMDAITAFRNNTGSLGLDYGAAYYPFLCTTVLQTTELDYTHLFGGDTTLLLPLLDTANNPDPKAAAILAEIAHPPAHPQTIAQYNAALLAASSTYTEIMQQVLADVNLLPPGGAMAGVITTNDHLRGVWVAPANVPVTGVTDVSIRLTDQQQQGLNSDLTGKSVNAIRFFPAQGILVWGARTLDGNSEEYRYLQVRRKLIYIEQSCKQILFQYVFSPNVAETWVDIQSAMNSFLTGLWSNGGLMGAKATEAFHVTCGLGSTMTAFDILNGILRVSVQLCIVHPAEFIEIMLEQQMSTDS